MGRVDACRVKVRGAAAHAAVALDRHLAACDANYDYDRDFGGIYYLFLRGFAPEHAPLCGVFHDRPPRAVVEGVAALLGQDAGEHAA